LSLVEHCLRQIDALDGELHAWVSVDRQPAVALARQRDDELRAGIDHGPLHGIPVGIKDLIDVAGWVTACGSPWMAKEPPALRDAPLIARLRAAGAILLGKTVTTQFACFDPAATLNPCNHNHTPGGSSSGSAAAVAAGMCLAAIGSQTGGSITRPASFCGVCGFKPTYGRISLEGVYPVAPSLDHAGPIARSVVDLGLVASTLVCPPFCGSVFDLIAAGHAMSPPRIGWLAGMFRELAHVDCLDAVNRALAQFAGSGAKIADAALPASFEDVLGLHRAIMVVEIAAHHEQRFTRHREDYLPRIRGLIEEGLQTRAVDYTRAKSCQQCLADEVDLLFEDCDVLACPATVTPAPDPSTTGNPAFNSPWSFTGHPTISFPLETNAAGLPVSLQLVGRRGQDEQMFRTALWCEQAWRQRNAVQ
jgi:aspartyl-tRNA(Asn)/glutamyl-tRNA(Gln) amidotransferase subunit A